MIRGAYRRLLQRLCRREIKVIADDYPYTRESLVQYFDYVAITCIEEETSPRERMLGIAVSTAMLLEQDTDSEAGFSLT